jgi:peptidoglycan hydrolase-like protein with peptidoglycan-binding domain
MLRLAQMTCSALAIALVMASGAQAAQNRSIVKSAQERLISLGYYTGPVDGVVGRHTTAALKEFQYRNGLPQTGTLNSETYDQLGFYNDQVRMNTAYYPYYSPRESYRTAMRYQQGWQSANTMDYVGANKAIPLRFGRMELQVSGAAGAANYTVTLNGQPVLYANNQPAPMRLSRVHQLGGEDAIIFTAYDGTGGCNYKNYLMTVKDDGTYTPAQAIGNCSGNYHARVDGDLLFLSFPSDVAALGEQQDVWRYGNSKLVRL